MSETDELYRTIGELFVYRVQVLVQNRALLIQADEMSREIERLRRELQDATDDHDRTIRPDA